MAKQIYIPTPEEISKMSIDKLNAEIRRLGNIANTRMRNLAKSDFRGANTGLEFMMKKAGEASPEKASSFGLASSFSTAKAKNVNAGRSSLTAITVALKSKKSKVSTLKESEKLRKESLSKIMFGEQKDPNKKQRILSDEKYLDLVYMLNDLKTVSGLDSNQIIDLFKKESSNRKFDSFDDFKKFVEERGEKGTAIMDYDDLSARADYYYDPIKEEFVAKSKQDKESGLYYKKGQHVKKNTRTLKNGEKKTTYRVERDKNIKRALKSMDKGVKKLDKKISKARKKKKKSGDKK